MLPGGIFVDSMFRKNGFYVSEVLKAIYEEYFVLERLKTVMVVDSPVKTKEFVKNQLYLKRQLRWPDGGAQLLRSGIVRSGAALLVAEGSNW